MSLSLQFKVYLLLKIAVWLLLLIYIVLTVPFVSSVDILYGISISIFLTRFTLITFLDNWYKLGRPLLLDWFRLSTFFTMVLNFLVIALYLDDNGAILVNNTVFVRSEHALTTLVVVFVGLMALKLSEVLFLNRKALKNSLRLHSKFRYFIKRRFWFYFLVMLVTILQFYMLFSGSIGYSSNIQNRFSSFSFIYQIIGTAAPFLLLLMGAFIFYFKRSSPIPKHVFFTFLIAQILFGFLSGMKENIVTPIILIAVPFLLGGHNVPRFALIFGFLFVMAIYPLNNNYRDILNSNAKFEQDKVGALKIAASLTFGTSIAELLASGSGDYSARLSLFSMAMYSIQEENSWVEYKNLDRYIVLPVAWIVPRFLMPDKPSSDTGSILYQMITGNTFNSLTPSTYGWSYFEGGIVYVFLTFLIFGSFICYIERTIRFNNIFGILIYSLVLVTMLKVESDIYFRIAGLLQIIFVNFILFKIFVGRRVFGT